MVRFSDIIKIRDRKVAGESPRAESTRKGPLSLAHSDSINARQNPSVRVSHPVGKANLEVISYYEKFFERAITIRECVKAGQEISSSPILSDLHYILEKGLVDDLYNHAMSAPNDHEEMLIHTLHVTIASLQIGKGMPYDTKRLLNLGLAAFFENVGMYRISEGIVKKEGKLNQEEMEVIKKHPLISADILGRMGNKYKWLAEVALQIHERADGSGYPKGLKGEEISELASVIGLADTYVALTEERPYRGKRVQTDAVKCIIKDVKKLFPTRILKAFVNQISLFPVHTYVRLNNACIGRVISTEKDQPMRPTIEVLYDDMGMKKEPREVIRLSENPLLYITETVDRRDGKRGQQQEHHRHRRDHIAGGNHGNEV